MEADADEDKETLEHVEKHLSGGSDSEDCEAGWDNWHEETTKAMRRARDSVRKEQLSQGVLRRLCHMFARVGLTQVCVFSIAMCFFCVRVHMCPTRASLGYF